jgi:hypothetical protein
MDVQNLKGIPPKLTQHIIELDTTIPLAHQVRYMLNPNYIIAVKHDIDKLLAVGFIQHVEKATWLSPIVVVPKKNGKFKFMWISKSYMQQQKKNPFPLPIFTFEALNIVVRCEACSFLDG